MELNKEMCEMIADLEYIIGSECYNPHSYDGWNDIEGCSFRYPVNFPNGKGGFDKMKHHIKYNSWRYPADEEFITPERISYMKYKFGANELFIGQGLIHVLNFLEQRYDLDFNELEAMIQASQNDTTK